MEHGADILDMLTHIEDVLRQIRDGECEPPRGAQGVEWKTPDDIYHALSSIVGLLERQNKILYNIGLRMVDFPDEWHKLDL